MINYSEITIRFYTISRKDYEKIGKSYASLRCSEIINSCKNLPDR